MPYSYGFAILTLTLLVKVVTFPLTKKQVEGSIQMQAIQPRVKELQAMYANDPERLQMETARLYKEANFNPLAGCLPTFATLPVIGLRPSATPPWRVSSPTASLDPLPRRPRVHRRPQRRHRFRMAHRFLLGRPLLGWRHHRVSRAPRAVGGVAVREQKIMQPDTGASTDQRSSRRRRFSSFCP